MNRKEVINQLKKLIEDRKSFMVGDYDEVYDKDVQVLEYAIKELTAQEVPVQEQNKFVPENSNGICKDTNKCINPQNNYLHEIEELCKPIYAYLKNNYDPHCSLSISDNQIKLNRTEIGILVKSND